MNKRKYLEDEQLSHNQDLGESVGGLAGMGAGAAGGFVGGGALAKMLGKSRAGVGKGALLGTALGGLGGKIFGETEGLKAGSPDSEQGFLERQARGGLGNIGGMVAGGGVGALGGTALARLLKADPKLLRLVLGSSGASLGGTMGAKAAFNAGEE